MLREMRDAAGDSGEFYTPRPVVRFMVEVTNPRLGETLLDPACGTGGFLVCAIEHLRGRYVHSIEDRDTLQRSFHGIEKKQLPHLLCTTNLLLHGIEVPSQVVHDNALARPLASYGPQDRVEVVVTNPPFGGMEEDGIETNFPSSFRTRETADLFLLLIMRRLQQHGRAAVVLPDGFLFGEGIKTRIKEKLLQECNLHTIVRLPKGVFNPYTGIKTNLLFFDKGQATDAVWYFEHPYPEGYKSYSKTKPIRVQEFEREKAWWNGADGQGRDGREGNDHAWRVPIEDIKTNNYNLDIKNPHSSDQGPGDPDELLARYLSLEDEIGSLREQLKTELAAALEHHR
jgi:type I restriction enzyme M protein